MLPPSRELEFLKFLDTLGQYLRSTREPRKAMAYALREGRAFFQASGGCIAVVEAGEPDAQSDGRAAARQSLGPRTHRPIHPAYPAAGPRRSGARADPAPRRRLGRDGLHASVAAVRSRRRPAAGPDHRGRVGRDPGDGSRTHARGARPHRPADHGADPSEGPLLPDPRRPPLADPLRSLVGAASSASAARTRSALVAEQIAWTKARSRHIGLDAAARRRPRADADLGRDPRVRSPRRRLARVDRQAGRAARRAARLQPRRPRGRAGARGVDALCAAGRPRRDDRAAEGRVAPSRAIEAVRCGARRPLPLPGRGRAFRT